MSNITPTIIIFYFIFFLTPYFVNPILQLTTFVSKKKKKLRQKTIRVRVFLSRIGELENQEWVLTLMTV